MKRVTLLSAILFVVFCSALPAQDADAPQGLRISRAVIARTVEAREPQGEGSSFPADVGQLVCYTHVEGANGETAIYHVWRHAGTLHAKVQLAVRSASWRTWSKKRIHPSWTGPWTVDIEDADGNVLQTLSFSIGGGAETGGTEGGSPADP